MLDTQYLDDLIKESGKTKSFLANKLGMSRQNFSNKINGKSNFKVEDFIILLDEIGVNLPDQVNRLIMKQEM